MNVDYERIINIIEAHDGKPRNRPDEAVKAIGCLANLLGLDTWTIRLTPGKGMCKILSIEGSRGTEEKTESDQRCDSSHSLKSGEISSSLES